MLQKSLPNTAIIIEVGCSPQSKTVHGEVEKKPIIQIAVMSKHH